MKLLERTLPARDLMQLLMRHRPSMSSQPPLPDSTVAAPSDLSQSASPAQSQSQSQPVVTPGAASSVSSPLVSSDPSARPDDAAPEPLPDFEGERDEPDWFRAIKVRARLDSTPLAGSSTALEPSASATGAPDSGSAIDAPDGSGSVERLETARPLAVAVTLESDSPEHCHCSSERPAELPAPHSESEGNSVDAFRSLLPDLRPEAALVSATPPSVSSCVELAALSPRALSSGQLSTLGADAGAPLRRTPTPPSASAAPVPAPDTAAAAAPVMNVGESDEEASACELCERDALNDSGDRRPQGLPAPDALATASASSAAPATSSATAAASTAAEELLAPPAASTRALPSAFLDCPYSAPKLFDSVDALTAKKALEKSIGCVCIRILSVHKRKCSGATGVVSCNKWQVVSWHRKVLYKDVYLINFVVCDLLIFVVCRCSLFRFCGDLRSGDMLTNDIYEMYEYSNVISE